MRRYACGSTFISAPYSLTGWAGTSQFENLNTMADQMVLKCVRDHNRPFNTQSVSDLLATKGVKKAQAQRSLDALAAAGKLRCKVRAWLISDTFCLRTVSCTYHGEEAGEKHVGTLRVAMELLGMASGAPELACQRRCCGAGVWKSETVLPPSRHQCPGQRGAPSLLHQLGTCKPGPCTVLQGHSS